MIMQKSRYKFSGDCLRKHLLRNRLTYQDAAKELEINKNTIGKVARSGNTTISVILHIANLFGIPIDEFFVKCESCEGRNENDHTHCEKEYHHKQNIPFNNDYLDDTQEHSQLNIDKFITNRLDQIITQLNRIEKGMRDKQLLNEE